MQTGGWCRSRSFFLGVNGLVPFFFGKLLFNIRWKRHLSKFIQYLVEYTFISKFHDPSTMIKNIAACCCQFSITKNKFRSLLNLFSWFCKYFPLVTFFLMQQQNFPFCPSTFLFTI